jgi:hypothetical protein
VVADLLHVERAPSNPSLQSLPQDRIKRFLQTNAQIICRKTEQNRIFKPLKSVYLRFVESIEKQRSKRQIIANDLQMRAKYNILYAFLKISKGSEQF